MHLTEYIKDEGRKVLLSSILLRSAEGEKYDRVVMDDLKDKRKLRPGLMISLALFKLAPEISTYLSSSTTT